MNKKSHTIITTIFLIGIWFIVKFLLKKDYFIWVFIPPSIIFSWFPDIDQSIPPIGHRNWCSHSILPEVGLFFLVLPYEINLLSFLFLLWIPVVGLHDLCDCRWNSRKRKGFYTIKIWMRPSLSLVDKENKQNIIVWKTLFGLNGAWSTIYLILNFLVGMAFLVAWLVIF